MSDDLNNKPDQNPPEETPSDFTSLITSDESPEALAEAEEASERDWGAEIANAKEQVKPLADSADLETAPRAPEKKEEKPKSKAGTTSMLNAGLMTNVSVTEARSIIEEYFKDMPDEQVEEMLKDEESWINKMAVCDMNGVMSSAAKFFTSAISDLYKEGKELVTEISDLKDSITNGGDFGSMLHGKTARLAFTAAMQGLKKVYLHNSGFNIKIRPFTNTELHDFFMSVDQEKEEYGRMLGGHFYLVQDLFIRQKFMELFPDAVVDCSLKDWQKGDNLIKSISIHDYDVILWALCSLMYRKGIEVPMVCADIECGAVSENILMDIDKFRVIDKTRITGEVHEFMSRKVVTRKECSEYVSSIVNKTEVVEYEGTELELCVPSIHKVLAYGESIMNIIMDNVNEGENSREDTILGKAVLNYNRCFVPWVNVVRRTNGDKTMSTQEPDVKADILELNNGTEENDAMAEEIRSFMKRSRVSFICYLIQDCPSCGKKPEGEMERYRAWEAQDLFFVLTYRKMEPIG